MESWSYIGWTEQGVEKIPNICLLTNLLHLFEREEKSVLSGERERWAVPCCSKVQLPLLHDPSDWNGNNPGKSMRNRLSRRPKSNQSQWWGRWNSSREWIYRSWHFHLFHKWLSDNGEIIRSIVDTRINQCTGDTLVIDVGHTNNIARFLVHSTGAHETIDMSNPGFFLSLPFAYFWDVWHRIPSCKSSNSATFSTVTKLTNVRGIRAFKMSKAVLILFV